MRTVTVSGNDTIYGGWKSTITVSRVPAPNQVTGLTAGRLSTDETKIDVNWTAPSGGTAATHYEVASRVDGGAWSDQPDRQATTNPPLTFQKTAASGKSTYQFRVRAVTVLAVNNEVAGSWTTSGTVSRVGVPNPVTGLTATRSDTDETQITVTWVAPSSGDTPTGYEIEYKRDGGNWTAGTTVNHPTVTHTSDVLGGSSYQYRVRAFRTLTGGEKLEGSWRSSNTVPKVSAPNRVTGLTATRQSDDETIINVGWNPPGSGTTPTGYDVEYRVDGVAWPDPPTAHGITATCDANSTPVCSFQLTGADGGSSYQFRVRAFRTLTTTNEKLAGSWTTSSTVRANPAGPVTGLTATRNTTDKTTIDLSWTAAPRATGYDVQYRKNTGSWQWGARAANQTTTSYTQTDAGGVETYTFRVRGVSSVGNGDWTESDEVGPPPLEWQGYEVGPTVADGKMAWITLKMASGPWWYEYRNHVGDWSSCKRVAAGSHTITGLRAPIKHIVEIFDAAGCNDGDRIRRENITTVDVQDTILDGTDPNNHTHKRQYPRLGVLGEGDCASDRMWHSHGWPNSGNWYGQHWHCQVYQ